MALYLVRHGKAGSRHDWKGPDDERPLSKRGRRQAEALIDLLGDRGIERVYSSPSWRCVQTVEPLAEKLGLAVESQPVLCEGTTRSGLAELVTTLLATTSAVCSHGDVIPMMLDVLVRDHRLRLPDDRPNAKGSTWEVAAGEDGRLVGRYLPPPKK